MNREQTSIRLNKADHDKIKKIKKAMISLGFPEAEITLSTAIRFAIERAAQAVEAK